jgi:hypothetical protein
MEEALLALLSAAADLLFEVLLQVVLGAIVALIVRSFQNVFEESSSINPGLAAVGYLLLGFAFGTATLFVYPHSVFHPSRFHGISLAISPLVTGLVMSQVGTLLRRKGKQAVRIESFGYGSAFALGWALIRFIGVK